MPKTVFSMFVLIFIISSFNCYAEQGLHPAWHDLLYRSEYQGYVSENRYETTKKVHDRFGNSYNQPETIYLVASIESGPHIGVQIFHNSKSGKTIKKDFPDTYIEAANGKGYYVYDYDSHVIYHNISEERMIVY